MFVTSHALGAFCTLSDTVVTQARELFVTVYSNKNEDFSGNSLSKLRAFKFLNNKSTLLKLLPPTEDAFQQHLRRAALATLLDKTAHIPKPSHFSWRLRLGCDGQPSSSCDVPSASVAPTNENSKLQVYQRLQPKLFLCKELHPVLCWLPVRWIDAIESKQPRVTSLIWRNSKIHMPNVSSSLHLVYINHHKTKMKYLQVCLALTPLFFQNVCKNKSIFHFLCNILLIW